MGIDMSAEAGAEVFAARTGTIESIYTSDVLVGTQIIIDHGDGIKSVYEYVTAKEGLKAGDKVNKGDVIATVAEANGKEYKDGAHLHFEIFENGKNVDPAKYLTLEEK
jgi:peptidase M23